MVGIEDKDKKIIEPTEPFGNLNVDSTKPPMGKPIEFTRKEPKEDRWGKVFLFGILCLLFLTVGIFSWGVYTGKFQSIHNTTCPNIDIPSCNCNQPTIPDCVCNLPTIPPCNCDCGSLICANVTCSNVTIYTNST
jgi:hypothetical protein